MLRRAGPVLWPLALLTGLQACNVTVPDDVDLFPRRDGGAIDPGTPRGGSGQAADSGLSSDAGSSGPAADGTTPDNTIPAPNTLFADLLADNNRNGSIDMGNPTEDQDEDSWTDKHGAIFLANIDDDEKKCPKKGSDVELASCNDAADEVINGADDLLDMARLRTRPCPITPDGSVGTLSLPEKVQTKVRLFLVTGASGTVFHPETDKLNAEQLRKGVEFAIEGKDIVRDASEWDGFVDIRFTVKTPDNEAPTDVVRMRVAPIITHHHLSPPETVYAAELKNDADSKTFITDLKKAAAAAGDVNFVGLTAEDQWTQDIFEPAYASMPSSDGIHAMRVLVRSANVENPNSTTNPLREAGKLLFTNLRGKDVGVIAHYDRKHDPEMDTLNSFGNTETVPPYNLGEKAYPLGRILRGKAPSFYPDPAMTNLFESQKVQAPIYVDTSWLLVAHVDETLSFVKSPSSRGWALLLNDPTLAKTMLQEQKTKGNGAVKMFVGLENYNPADPMSEDLVSATISISSVLNDPDIMAASAEAAVNIDSQLQVLKKEVGIRDEDIVRIPYLHTKIDGRSIAYQPATVNGISLGDSIFGAPDPHGPVIGGKDIMKSQMQTALNKLGITVKWIEDWSLYHINEGEVHCGSNTTRKIPVDTKWWETGR